MCMQFFLLQKYCGMTGSSLVLYSPYFEYGFNACVLLQLATIGKSVSEVIALHKG